MSEEFHLSTPDLGNLVGVTRQAITMQIGKHPKFQGVIPPRGTLASVSPDMVREILISRGYKYIKKKSMAFQIVKGGVGKSSLSKNIAIRAAQYGYKTLLIDFDHQLNLTISLNAFDESRPVWIDFLKGQVKTVQELVVPLSENLDIIPSSPKNCTLDREIILGAKNLRSLIAEPIRELHSKYEIIVVDCPPALSHLTHAIYLGVDQIIAPAKPDIYSVIGLEQVFDQWRGISESYGQSPDIKVLINMYDPRINASTRYLQELFSRYGDYILPNLIRQSADFVSTMEQRQHLWTIRRSQAGEEVDLVVRHLLKMENIAQGRIAGATAKPTAGSTATSVEDEVNA